MLASSARFPQIAVMSSRLAPALVVAAVAASAHAGGFGIPEIGVRRTGMARSSAAPTSASAIYHNPAGLSLQHGWNLYLSMGLALSTPSSSLAPWDQSDRFLGITPGPDGYYAPVQPSRALGVIPMLAVTGEILPGKLALGAAMYVGNAQGAAFDEDAVTHYHLIDGYVVAPQARDRRRRTSSTSTLSVGASVGLLTCDVHGKRDVFPIINGTDISSTYAGTKPELVLDGTAWAPTWLLAAFGSPHPRSPGARRSPAGSTRR